MVSLRGEHLEPQCAEHPSSPVVQALAGCLTISSVQLLTQQKSADPSPHAQCSPGTRAQGGRSDGRSSVRASGGRPTLQMQGAAAGRGSVRSWVQGQERADLSLTPDSLPFALPYRLLFTVYRCIRKCTI